MHLMTQEMCAPRRAVSWAGPYRASPATHLIHPGESCASASLCQPPGQQMLTLRTPCQSTPGHSCAVSAGRA